MPQAESAPPIATTRCRKLSPSRPLPGLIEDVQNGLLEPPRSLPPKYFYDARGAVLFEQITETPEYYPTRTEDRLLADHARDIIDTALPDQILELGSGSSRKTRHLFDACAVLDHASEYAPLDVCEPALVHAAAELSADYPWLQVRPIAGDYHAGLEHLPRFDGARLIAFLGSTIGNFKPAEARRFLTEVHDTMQPGDYLLLGADRVKDAAVLHAAYNDAAGVTAEFNLNLLRVLNREVDADFRPDRFEHRAIYNAELQRVEMHLVSNDRQTVRLGRLNRTIDLYPGETILTELSHKFTTADLERLVGACSLEIREHYQAPGSYFSLLLVQRKDSYKLQVTSHN